MVTPELALELERRVGPVGALSKRIYNADFQVKDIHSIIHVALLGGGMDADEAMRVMTPMFATLP